MTVLQNMNVDPVKEMAAEISAEEANPTPPQDSFRQGKYKSFADAFDAEQAKAPEAVPEDTQPPAEAEENKAETAQEPTDDTVIDEDKPQARVPIKAVHEAREKARQAEERARELERQVAEFQGYQRAQAERQQQAQEPEVVPDPETDPIGALKWMQQRNAQLEQRLQQEQQVREQQAGLSQFQQHYANEMRAYVTQNPEAKDAYQFTFNNRVNELIALGVQPGQAHMQVQQEELGLAVDAFRSGRHPGDTIVALAKARGFTGKKAEVKADPQAQVAQQQEKNKAAVGLSKGGSSPRNGPTLEQILQLKGAAFDKAMEKYETENSGRRRMELR